MKKSALLFCTAFASAYLAGCAATPSAPPSPMAVDAEKVAAVEAAARRSGVTIIWVNPPKEK